ncbi:PP2C family protein-serine/threonine phosphatase [Nocardia asteroides]|uniref:PP2C family protein-serine/threonine phosphatase n=1 Tax=Nocardia asteroides TaxID=1824 RepID=UPI001E4A243D|nr:protein phosphatase 2C domain-containing protein [Nocardia asteroides]UGT58843.1 protein phosphatase 2C domain-containing protein [Nocardia asteroides]
MTRANSADTTAGTSETATILVGAASLIGGRTVQQDAHHWVVTEDGCVVAAVADGVGSVPRSEVIAAAAARAVVAFGARPEYRDDPAHAIELARITMTLHADHADTERADVFYDHEFGDPWGRHPDTTVVMATAEKNGEIHIGWIGDCRAWVHLHDGRLVQLTEDHNPPWDQRTLTRSLVRGNPENAHWHRSSIRADRPRHLVLTSDGVHDVLCPTDIGEVLTHAQTPQLAATWMTDWAVRDAGPSADNATALVAELPNLY